MHLGMEEGHQKFRDDCEEIMNHLNDLVVAHIAFTKHDA